MDQTMIWKVISKFAALLLLETRFITHDINEKYTANEDSSMFMLPCFTFPAVQLLIKKEKYEWEEYNTHILSVLYSQDLFPEVL